MEFLDYAITVRTLLWVLGGFAAIILAAFAYGITRVARQDHGHRKVGWNPARGIQPKP